MTTHDSAHEDSEDRFYAQFDSREVELMTLDELQAAFEAGQIHENTFVCREGDSEWLTLADVAGLGEEEPEPAPVVETRPPMPSRRPDAPAATETRPPMPSRRPVMNTVPAARFQAAAVPTIVVSSTPLSFAPVSSNIDYPSLDMDDMALRPKRRWGLVLAAAAVLALAGGGTVFALNGGGRALASAIPSNAALEAAASKSQASLTLANIQTKASEPAAPVAPVAPSAPEPVAAPAQAEAAPADAPKAKGEFSDDMKQALLAADKKHQAKHVAKAKARATASAPRKGKALSAGGFKSGGSAYDPLNGKL
jgi:hypothetical protein